VIQCKADRTRMEKFFFSRSAQVVSGAIVGFVLGMALKNAIVAFVGPKLFMALASGMGLFVVLTVVILALFVGFTMYARAIHRFNPQSHNQ